MYVNGDINIVSINIEADKQFWMKLFLQIIIIVRYIIPIITVKTLYIILRFFLISGLLTVSAGANNIKFINDILAIINNIYIGNVIYLHINGIPINVGTDVIQQIQDLEACIPNAVVLNILNNSKVMIVSLKILRKIDNNNITITFVSDKYIDSSPY